MHVTNKSFHSRCVKSQCWHLTLTLCHQSQQSILASEGKIIPVVLCACKLIEGYESEPN